MTAGAPSASDANGLSRANLVARFASLVPRQRQGSFQNTGPRQATAVGLSSSAGVAVPAIRDKAKRAIRHRTARSQSSCPMFYPTGGCVPQSGEFEPGACVTCVKPVPSRLTV